LLFTFQIANVSKALNASAILRARIELFVVPHFRMNSSNQLCRRCAPLLFILLMANHRSGAETKEGLLSLAELKGKSIDELLNIDVTTVSRQPEKWFGTASAVQVITEEEIRRSGATSLPEALRLAPNLQVAQVSSSSWAISSRGFNNGLANKLLVLMDGRTLYTPLFAGVFWDVQDTLLEDIDRIEVISGPGGTLWGANAVNGVINIITKSAKDTQGTLLMAGGGSFLQDFVGARYGDKLGENVYFRLYGKYFDRNGALFPDGSEAPNDWRMGQGGFRLDWLPKNQDMITFQGDFYSGSLEQAGPGTTGVDGQNILGRWTHPISESSDLTVQLYWDRTYRRIPNSFIEELNTYDFDFQHRFGIGERQNIIWGAAYRLMPDHIGNSNPAGFSFMPPDRNLQLFSAFVQDEIALVPDHLRFTVGTKLEHNDYSDFEVQPSGRLAWAPDDQQTFWGAVSRAVRSPSRIDKDLFSPPTPAFPGGLAGGPGFDSESVIAYELGYRVRPAERIALSVATFFNDYTDIRSLATNSVSNNAFVFGNDNQAEVWGVELSSTYEITSWWRLRAGYTFLHKHVSIEPGGSDANRGRAEGNDPDHQVICQSIVDLPFHLEFDSNFRYVDNLPSPAVPSYYTFDLRLAWRPIQNLEISIVGQNLVDDQHPEFGAALTRQEIPRSVYGKVVWRF
jgi:iron complex outermembrane recepter protein